MKTINGEPVEQVTEFGQLRAGLIVWTEGCLRCGGMCRAILTVRAVTPMSWRCLPKCTDTVSHQIIGIEGIRTGRVFAVVDPLLDAKTTERKREAVRG